jgi:hypothetical protein
VSLVPRPLGRGQEDGCRSRVPHPRRLDPPLEPAHGRFGDAGELRGRCRARSPRQRASTSSTGGRAAPAI